MNNGTGMLIGGLLLALTTGASAGQARQDSSGHYLIEQRVVRFDDLDLYKPAGAAALHARLRMAAREVCPRDVHRPLKREQSAEYCRTHALEEALAKLPVVTLQAYHAQWVAAGSKWLIAPAGQPAQRVVARQRAAGSNSTATGR